MKAPSVSSDTDFAVRFSLDNNTDSSIENQTQIGTLTVQNTASGSPELLDAVHYDDTGNEGAGVELSFSEPVKIPDSSDITLYDEDGNTVSATLEPSASSGTLDGRYFLDTSGTILTEDIEVELSSDISDANGNSLPDSDTGNNSVTVAPVTVKLNDDRTVYEGSNVAIVNDSRDVSIQLEGPNDFFFDGSTDTNSEVFVFNTTDRDLGEYNVSIDGSTIEDTQFTLRDLELSVEVADTSVSTDDTIETDVNAVAGKRGIQAVLLDSNGDEINTSSVTQLDGQGEADVDFDTATADEGSELDTGTYTVEVTDNSSGVTVESTEITVSQAADEEAGFASNVITDQRGDIVEATVELTETSEATLTFGSAEDGVVANATVEDDDGDDEVTVYVNTYRFDNNVNEDVFNLDSDSDDALIAQNLEDGTDNLVDAGDYDLEVQSGDQGVSTGQGVTESDDVATVTLEERGTETLRTWTGSSGELGSLSDLEDVNEALEDEQITQSSDVAVGDLAVHQLEASGLEGALDARANEDVTTAFSNLDRNGPINLTIEEASPGANQDASALNLSYGDNVTVIADGPNDTYFVVVDTGEVDFDAPRDEALPSDEDTELETNFTVLQDDAGFDFTPDEEFEDDENAETLVEFTAEEPEASVDEPYNVSQASGQTVSGTTNIAPGTELTLRVSSQSGVSPSFLKTASPTVQSDGTFSATFDFSQQNVGDEYDIVVSNTLLASDEEESGTVVEAVETATPTPEPDTATPEPDGETATPEPDTATPEPDTDTPMPDTDTPTSTPTSTPGFGVIVALTALLAAALLTVRRD
ncbi:DUF7827 domain-containing protein [Halobellus ruber]|uniref:PGF-CTERM sorting domain-containing protein n=1 Tax=Halobellus ruber TaxID=2761102 RepID=A0A7J9SFY7_9EURY|nr:PGF-CTERM sorting domain-containing protein [Halobellus ruber]